MAEFKSQFAIDDSVKYQIVKYNQIGVVCSEYYYGTIVSVRFTKGKVMYDVLDDVTTKVHRDIYSENVSEVQESKQPNQNIRTYDEIYEDIGVLKQ